MIIRLKRKKLTQWQSKAIADRNRFNIYSMGRRAGKTTLGEELLSRPEVLQKSSAWFAPTYKDSTEVWRHMCDALEPLIRTRQASQRRLEFITGGTLEFWSLDNPNAGRGRKYARVVVDEAAFVRNLSYIWNMTILPTLADYRGDAWIFSTPKGKNDFYRLFQHALDNPQSWTTGQLPTSANPFIAPSEIEHMRATMTESAYQQEILAQFLDDGGGVFRKISQVIDENVWEDEPTVYRDRLGRIHQHDYIFGVDWGKYNDYTVVTVLDIHTNKVVHIDRFNQINFSLQRDRLKRLYDLFDPTLIIAERNSIGDPNIEELESMGLPIEPFNTSNASKKVAIESLALAIEQQEIVLPDYKPLIRELEAFETERLPSGMLRYNAPTGMHDDCVMSLAVAWHGVAEYAPAIW